MRKLSKNKSLLIKFGKPYDKIILRSYKDKFFYVLAKKYSFGRSLRTYWYEGSGPQLLYLLQVEQFILRQFLLFQFLHSLYHTKE